MKRWVGIVCVALASLGAVGCGSKELGPADADSVKKEDPAVIKKGMEESAKHLPPGVKMPPGVIPGQK